MFYFCFFLMRCDYFFPVRLTYKLTHMYYNWPGTIRVPAPCQVSEGNKVIDLLTVHIKTVSISSSGD